MVDWRVDLQTELHSVGRTYHVLFEHRTSAISMDQCKSRFYSGLLRLNIQLHRLQVISLCLEARCLNLVLVPALAGILST